jgi:hypothetical protein
MAFSIAGLAPKRFEHLRGLSDTRLAELGARRVRADRRPGFPDRVEMRDAEPGESLLLVNFVHLATAGPYRASHAVYVIEAASRRWCGEISEVPDVLRSRLLSLRAFDADDMLVDADVVDGGSVEGLIERLLGRPEVSYVHAHYARPGCFACRIDRA